MKPLSLLNDVFFKIVFASEPHSEILRALLNALLDLTEDEEIVELEILNPFLDKSYLLDKGAVLDVKARDGRRRLYNIEVQVSREPAYVERALYYLARLYSSQLDRGEGYDELARTIGISLLDFELFAGQLELHSRFRMYDEAHRRELTDILELHFIELSKFRTGRPDELRTRFDKWLHLLKFGELYETSSNSLPNELAQEEGIEMAVKAMRTASASEEVRQLVEMRMDAERNWTTKLRAAQQEGRKEGLVEVARRMRQTGVSIEEVERLTGLKAEAFEK